MYKFFQIIRDYNSTFFDHQNNVRINPTRGYLFRLLLAFILSLFLNSISTSIIDYAITSFSILLGFSFSVGIMFAAGIESPKSRMVDSIEGSIRKEKYIILEKYILKILTYSASTSIFVVFNSFFYQVIYIDGKIYFDFPYLSGAINTYIQSFLVYLEYIFLPVYFFIIIESLYSFLRMLKTLKYTIEKYIIE